MKRCAAFSLPELLTVLVIVSVLFTVGASAFHQSASRRLAASGEVIGSMVSLARSTAFNKRRPTALAVPVSGEHAYRMMALFVCEPTASGQEVWKQGIPWESLPAPVVFDPQAPLLAASSDAPAGFPAKVRITGKDIAASELRFLIFNARGMVETTGVPRLRLVAGTLEGNQLTAHTNAGTHPFYDILFPEAVRGVKYRQP